jgi:hydrophobe/amphiphile efflux-1 (HAE1) family protein
VNFSQFFIKRPIFAAVLSILITVVGALSLRTLPVSEYPEIVPPSVVVRAIYPGASADTLGVSVAKPLEEAMSGIQNLLYMGSMSTNDGVMQLTMTFQLGTDLDKAQVAVQNRVNQALPRLPEDVRRLGVTTLKSSPDLTMVVHLLSDGRYDEVYVRNYATIQIKDVLARIPGAGQVQVFGGGEYSMRIWLDPEKIASRNLSVFDIVRAVQEQNAQVAAGSVGALPLVDPSNLTLTINARGRLETEEEFGEIVIKGGGDSAPVFLRDVARIELGASEYSLRALLNNKTAVALPIFQSPGSNALELSANVRKTMEELKANFPEGLNYAIAYDPTVFVSKSIEAVKVTLLEAIGLVVLVVIIFLQTWRASIIPLVAVPVSLIGTFAVMHMLGFSINNLSLFGLVLAIGIVVDDAIVVVENVERNIALGFAPVQATERAMREVSGPIIATALVLCAVFIPTAFISGLTGQFYKQFAITIAISTVISAFNSLTLSPALSAILLRPHGAKRDILTRVMDFCFGWFFRIFNRVFERSASAYGWIVRWGIRLAVVVLVIYGALVYQTKQTFDAVPEGFVPVQDKQYLVAFCHLPEGSSLERTDAVIRKMSDLALATPGVKDSIAFPGLSVAGFSVSTNEGIVFVGLKDFKDRTTPDLTAKAIAGALNGKFFGTIHNAFALAVEPPPVNGSTIGGFKLQIQDRTNLGYAELFRVMQQVTQEASKEPALGQVFSNFEINVPQLDAIPNRIKAKAVGVNLQELFGTMQVYFGSLYINDFNRFGRTYQVVAQADGKFRRTPDDIRTIKVRNTAGEMVPINTVLDLRDGYGPARVMHYNSYTAADINGVPAPGRSSGEAEAAMTRVMDKVLPKGMKYEWTELTYQKILAGNTAVLVYPLCLLLVFLVLAAQYESLRLPLVIILIVPMCLLSAMLGVQLTHGDNNIFTQIGLIVLVGLACKNAILIVEFAKAKQDDEHMAPAAAAIEASRLRLRPILMTSIAFIAGVWPLVNSHGAGAEMRKAMGVAVFSGMIGVTLFGLLLTPVFYVVFMKFGWKKKTPALPETEKIAEEQKGH